MQIGNSVPVTPDALYGVLGVLAFLLTIAVQVWTMVRGRNPQPFAVREDSGFVDRRSYHKHCEINRDEHKRIEAKFAEEIRALGHDHNSLAREVSGLTKAVELTSARLTQIDHKLDKLLTIARQSHEA